MKWIQVKIDCKTEDLDTVCAIMSVIDCHLQIDDASDVVEANPIYGELIDEELLKKKDHSSVSIYLSEEDDTEKLIQGLKTRIEKENLDCDLDIVTIDEDDWADNWKQYYKPIKIGEKLVIVPEWEEYNAENNEVIVKMDPGMAFGTGTHETTQLCASLIEKYMPQGATVLDVGTGSGILSLCASKLGAKEVCGYDIDPVSVKVAKENALLNECYNVQFAQSDLLAQVDGIFNFAAANITAEIVMRMSNDIAKYLVKGSYLAVSGVIDEQCKDVCEKMDQNGMGLVEENHLNGWSGLLFIKK